jgi:3-hydroxyisobutyrate dehydrogenase-like beta-hydroxyacid dehydrogenase
LNASCCSIFDTPLSQQERDFMAKLGFLGLGIMGGPMAQHLAAAKHDVSVWSHNKKKAKQLAESSGATFRDSPAEVGRNADCIFLCVGNTDMAREVILGPEGLVRGVKQGAVIADCSTVSAHESVRIS